MSLRLPAPFVLEKRASVGSTNDEASALAAKGAPEGTLVWAQVQTGGRGRRGRAWISPPGNLHC
ncbi:MAG: biotin--[acetyl-CoA-carboxylase] ligase, partial [Rhodospirillales bacterium]